MIVMCGADEFPSGAWTEQLAALFAERVDADLVLVNGGTAEDRMAAQNHPEDVVLFGHAPLRRVAASLRAAPGPVAIAAPGVSAGDWGEVVLGSDGDSCTEEAAAIAGELAARLGAVLRIVVVGREGGA